MPRDISLVEPAARLDAQVEGYRVSYSDAGLGFNFHVCHPFVQGVLP